MFVIFFTQKSCINPFPIHCKSKEKSDCYIIQHFYILRKKKFEWVWKQKEDDYLKKKKKKWQTFHFWVNKLLNCEQAITIVVVIDIPNKISSN